MNLEVVTPKGTAVTAEVDEVTAPGVRGEFGILPGHTPFVTALRPGVLTWKKGGPGRGSTGVLAIASGFAEVNGKDKIIVLTQLSATPDEIDGAAVQKELEELDRTTTLPREDVEARRAWAQARLDARSTARS